MTDVIASGVVRLDADTSPAERDIARFQADFDRRMGEMDRQRATAQVELNAKQFDRRIAEIKTEIVALEKAHVGIDVELDDGKAKADIARLKLELKELNAQKAHLRVDVDQVRAGEKAVNRLNKQLAASEKEQDRAAAAAQRRGQMHSRALADEEKRVKSLRVAESRAWAEEEKRSQSRGQLMARALRDNQRFNDERIKGERTLAKMQMEAQTLDLRRERDLDRMRVRYSKLLGEQQRVRAEAKKPFGLGLITHDERRGIKASESELRLLEHEIGRLGGSVHDINPDIERNQGLLGKWSRSIASIRLQMGFFSATLRQLAIGVVALGPVVTGLVGSVGALIGVLGTGLAGALAVTGGALGGFALSAVGVGLVLKPAIEDFQEATKRTEELHKAYLKYGKGSDQVKAAQEKLNNTLKGIDPVAKKAVKGWTQVKQQWGELTKEAKKPIFEGLASSVETMKELLPDFAKETVKTTKVASDAWQGWMKGLRSNEAKEGLKTLMSNFRAAIPSIADGLGSLASAFGRISVSASKMLPSLTKGFSEWAQHFEDAIGSGPKLDASIRRLVGHMRDLGHLFQDTGSFLVHFFDAGANAGDDMIRTLDRVIRRWDDWAQSAGGHNSLENFFHEAVSETEKLFSVLGHVFNVLFQIGRAGAPISDVILQAATFAGDLVTNLAPLRSILNAAAWAGVLGFIISKAKKFGTMIRGTLETVASFNLAGGLLGGAGAGVGSGAKRETRQLSLLTGEASAARAELDALGVAAGTAGGELAAAEGKALSSGKALGAFSALLSPQYLVPAAGLAALGYLITQTGHAESAFESAGKAAEEAGDRVEKGLKHMQQASLKYTGTQNEQRRNTEDINTALKHFNKLMNEDAPLKKQWKARLHLNELEEKQGVLMTKTQRQNTRSIHEGRALVKNAEERVDAAQKERKVIEGKLREQRKAHREAERETGEKLPYEPDPSLLKERAKAMRDEADARKQVAKAQAEQAVATVPLRRNYAKLEPITVKTQKGLQQLSKTIGRSGVENIGKFVKADDVKHFVNLGNALTKIGRGKQVQNIAVHSKGADQANRKLERLSKNSLNIDKKVTRLNVKTNDQDARQKLTRLSRLSQRLNGTKPTLKILATSTSAEQAVTRLKARLENTVHKEYKAEITAADKTDPGYTSAYHKLRDIANQKAEAKIKAIDEATNPAKKAKGAIEEVDDRTADIKLTGAKEAAKEANHVAEQLNKIESKTVTIKTIYEYEQRGHKPSHYAGGPSVYMPALAQGGDARQRMVDRAAEKAVVRRGNRSQRVNRPTMLTGEEAPSHPEYVIATNPAFRQDNVNYLESAANDLGYETIPAYRRGRAHRRRNRHKPHKPHKHKKPSKKYIEKASNKFGHGETAEDYWRGQIEFDDSEYNNQRSREETDIEYGPVDEEGEPTGKLNYASLKSWLEKERKAYHKLESVLNARIGNNADRYKTSTHELATKWSAAKEAKAKKNVKSLKKKVNQTKNEKKKKGYEQKLRQAENKLEKIENKRSAAKDRRTESKQSMGDDWRELNQVIPTELGNLENEIHELILEEGGKPEEKEGGEGGGAAGSTAPSLAEQTSSYNTAREALYKEFASNITAGERTPTSGGASAGGGGGALSVVSSGSAGALSPASAASVAYTPEGAAQSGAVRKANESTSGGGLQSGVTVINNFANVPADPHTWSKGVQFELGALS